MTTRKPTRKPNFWMVLIGLFLLIGLIAGGTYALNEAGYISAAGMPDGGAPSDFAGLTDADSSDTAVMTTDAASTDSRPAPPEGMEDGRSSQALTGFAKALGQMALVITLVYYGQKLFGWLEKRLRRPRLTNQAA
ncbi:MAG: hypothetical protein H6667_10055 [Ardenticatenaceae bacterium]|nr:hypothetical protein [Ardenticatenaceae bacterium]MCB9446687.1 hypothetical protein [Ardenticatenaceae bacterium]